MPKTEKLRSNTISLINDQKMIKLLKMIVYESGWEERG